MRSPANIHIYITAPSTLRPKYINHNLAACRVIAIAQSQSLKCFIWVVFFLSDDKSSVIAHMLAGFSHRARSTHAVHISSGRHKQTRTAEPCESRFRSSQSSFPCHSIAPCPLVHALYVRCRKVGCQFPLKTVKEV